MRSLYLQTLNTLIQFEFWFLNIFFGFLQPATTSQVLKSQQLVSTKMPQKQKVALNKVFLKSILYHNLSILKFISVFSTSCYRAIQIIMN